MYFKNKVQFFIFLKTYFEIQLISKKYFENTLKYIYFKYFHSLANRRGPLKLLLQRNEIE